MLIYGKQPVYYALERHRDRIKTLYLAKEVEKKEYSALMKMGFEIKRIPEQAAQAMVKGGNHQGFIADISQIVPYASPFLKKCDFVVILSSITDMGNIGSLIRSAYALGVDAIVISGIKEPNLEPMIRTSSGAALDMPLVIIHNIHDVLHELKQSGFQIYGAVMDGEDIRQTAFASKRALVLGNEGEGLSGRVQKSLDVGISIPMAHDFDSLNVGVAGAILMERMR
ncbi:MULTISPECIES: 23S rRNA (guanosine(2251)-2'-O)-methyltransferase RlmB [unclassified Sulfuricurvum]|uniref:23S rRNA (guanosine(2251)-2'-O)-methyltransferase RlmB n=1 Tax=unclassified Sulfuricurvum TaxID=2632390 RepID=UPI00029962A2|nr:MULTISPECIES: 23S rRNA (guanosine(2251)-2'-O)-methyltransferase RlmB [unclassified Sulfuricurvum]OHD82530.1 MAG: 23S rRNA (guanosine(2251)-2'-O)-methyltransferase RlmB [Sulfuricurvum sp. RIFCSPHIGHO2_02_FULL_43_9]OHD85371.1 MAG: 23S rRNA (guanosine(2251)-2'-O)-methyltransferase RlmB [Sulfuricurvum sp. RIFCSPLOWO2_02_FULL_43_45]OHD85868.1 MAG: 23S rRNA (guanosine(2251)-2'-O)-methyltransferase RlmB [Sulfuricurvum sp. RIFCSPLOWO2_02_43_6]OHD87310.1 MAG: 23S rRNA (guanosine(2251)-2'-O)-methyltra